jgi:hypothetical protein
MDLKTLLASVFTAAVVVAAVGWALFDPGTTRRARSSWDYAPARPGPRRPAPMPRPPRHATDVAVGCDSGLRAPAIPWFRGRSDAGERVPFTGDGDPAAFGALLVRERELVIRATLGDWSGGVTFRADVLRSEDRSVTARIVCSW